MNELQIRRAKIVNSLIVSLAVALLPISVLVLYFGFKNGFTALEILQLLSFGVIWLVAYFQTSLETTRRALLIIALLIVAALSKVYHFGILSATFPILAILPVVAATIGGIWFGLASIAFVTLGVAAVGWLTVTTGQVPPVAFAKFPHAPSEWVVRILNLAITSGIGVVVAAYLYRYMEAAKYTLLRQNSKLQKPQSRILQSGKLAGLGYAMTNQKTGAVLECDAPYTSQVCATTARIHSTYQTHIFDDLRPKFPPPRVESSGYPDTAKSKIASGQINCQYADL